ncbi:TPA: hypothetical protein OMT51_002334 [Enterobacter hormaechei]|nr:hypothetical protein [Enterobacter hormaechei]
MATTPTNLPVPSESYRDLKYNAGKFDEVITSFAEWYIDRFGNKHYTVQGLKALFDSKIYEWDQIFQQFLVSSGYQFLGDYVDGPLTFTERNQYIRYDGQYWKLNAETDLDFTTTGTDATSWSSDVTHLSLIDGDTLRQELASDNGSNLVATRLPYTSSVKRTQTDKNLDVYTASDFGIKGDGTDETQKLLSLITNRNGRKIDLQGLTISFSGINLTEVSDLVISNGALNYVGGSATFAFKINTSARIILNDIALNGNSVPAKGLYLNASSNEAQLYISGFKGRNFRETTTGLASGIFATSDSSVFWDKVVIDNSSVYDITNAGTGTNVGRGILIHNFKLAICTRLDIRRVAPYQDADGIFALSPNYPAAVFICDDSYFEDCQKRSVKSQIMNSRISNITAKRTQSFTVGAGQTEVDLQAGGSLDGLSCFYADGSAPQSIVSGGYVSGATVFKGVALRNIDVHCDDSTDIIPRLVSFFNNFSGTYDGYVAENIKCNAIIENMCYFYGLVGNSSPTAYIFNEVILRNIQASGISSSPSSAVVQISRGNSQYVKAIVRLQNCNLGDGKTAPISYLDTTPGSTTFLDVLCRQVSNCRGFDVLTTANSDTAQRIYATFVDVAENSAATLSIPIRTVAGRTAIKVSVMYNSSRDLQAAKLFTEGYLFYGATTPYYVESVAGVKTNANTGSISITSSGNSIAINKTAGSTSSGGRLTAIVEHIASVDVQ